MILSEVDNSELTVIELHDDDPLQLREQELDCGQLIIADEQDSSP